MSYWQRVNEHYCFAAILVCLIIITFKMYSPEILVLRLFCIDNCFAEILVCLIIITFKMLFGHITTHTLSYDFRYN